MRGTLANVRLRNQLAPGVEGPWTTHVPTGEKMWIYDAAVRYKRECVGLVILAGKEYGSGSSRDWAAKGVALLGVKAVIARSFERIHRSNLVGMGILPLQFAPGESAADSLGSHRRGDVRRARGRRRRAHRETAARATPPGGDSGRLRRDRAHRHPAGVGSTTATAASSTSSCASALRRANGD